MAIPLQNLSMAQALQPERNMSVAGPEQMNSNSLLQALMATQGPPSMPPPQGAQSMPGLPMNMMSVGSPVQSLGDMIFKAQLNRG